MFGGRGIACMPTNSGSNHVDQISAIQIPGLRWAGSLNCADLRTC